MKKITFILLASVFGISTAIAQPSNDLCANATPISSGNSIAFDTTSATIEETTGCMMSSNGPEVWFTYTETETQVVTFTTCQDANFDTKISVFSGGCGPDLVCVIGNDDDQDCNLGWYSKVVYGSIIGTTYYVKVHGWNSGGIGTGNLTMSGSLLELGEFELNDFEYFPNPVKDNLSLKGESNIQSVAVYNMLGQEIKRLAPNTLETEVNMATLSQGSYFVKVSINDVSQTIRIIKK